jgi:hypothetical protein
MRKFDVTLTVTVPDEAALVNAYHDYDGESYPGDVCLDGIIGTLIRCPDPNVLPGYGWHMSDVNVVERRQSIADAAPLLLAACEKLVAEISEQCVVLGWESAEQFFAASREGDGYKMARDAIAAAKGGA